MPKHHFGMLPIADWTPNGARVKSVTEHADSLRTQSDEFLYQLPDVERTIAEFVDAICDCEWIW